MEKVWAHVPQLELITDEELKAKTKKCFEEAITRGGWSEDDAVAIPFTLLIPNCPVSLLQHTASVTQIAIQSAQELSAMYPNFKYDKNMLIAGGILHDVGKFLEYAKSPEGKIVKSSNGKYLRHPFSGAALAYEMRLPDKVVHMIAVHAHEGDEGYRCEEAILVNKADFTTFETLKRFLGVA